MINVKNNNSPHTDRKKICIVATVPFVLRWFMTPHILLLSKEYDVTLITNGSPEELNGLLGEHVSFILLNIERKVSLIKDVLALIKLRSIFVEKQFDCVHSITPKAGLLTMLAGRFANIPNRFHIFTGQVWANKQGFRRLVLKYLDKLLVCSSTRIFVDSNSQRLYLIENNVVSSAKVDVLADGSAAGVNLNRFEFDNGKRITIRQEKNIPEEAIVFLFLGRLAYDKGLLDLAKAFEQIAASNDNLHLLVVGPDEDNLSSKFVELEIKIPGKIHLVGFTDYPEDYMSASDIFCLPSYREGFGSVIIEAAAIGIPAIASRIYGITDAINDRVSGILHEPMNVSELSSAMKQLAEDTNLRDNMGLAAKDRAISKFSEQVVADAMLKFYHTELSV